MTDFDKATAIIVGAGPAGLAAGIAMKKAAPEASVLVLDKSAGPGAHILSGAVVEPGPLERLMDLADPAWREDERARSILGRRVRQDEVLMFLGRDQALPATPLLRMARAMGMGPGHMLHKGDYILSAARLVTWLDELARKAGVEILYGFGVDAVVFDEQGKAIGVRTVEQGLNRERQPQRNHQPARLIRADFVMLAEGSRGYVTESTIEKAGLEREQVQLHAIGVKEIVEVSPARYADFGDDRVVHALGFPLWTPVVGPAMYGGGFMYPMGDNRIAVGIITGLDWKYMDFVPQEALVRFKEHAFVRRFLEGGTVVEAGARMIPEGGYHALPRNPADQSLGRDNVLLLGDCAGLVDMHRIKGLHNALASGMVAGQAAADHIANPAEAARAYTDGLEACGVMAQMRSARNFRQVLARMGNLLGIPLTAVGPVLPRIEAEADWKAMEYASYPHRLEHRFDKDAFTALAHVEHREDQPIHCEVLDERICNERCASTFDRPCIHLCLGGVYEMHHGEMKPVNASNCIHCKTCECKCPFDNLRWHVPEGGGGPHYEGT